MHNRKIRAMAHSWPDPPKMERKLRWLSLIYFCFFLSENSFCTIANQRIKNVSVLFNKLLNQTFYMTHTFESEVSLHYWLLWPTVWHLASFKEKKEQMFLSKLTGWWMKLSESYINWMCENLILRTCFCEFFEFCLVIKLSSNDIKTRFLKIFYPYKLLKISHKF